MCIRDRLYAAERLTLNKKMMMEKLEVTKRKILRKILGSIKDGEQYTRRHNNELCTRVEKITDVIRKRRIIFYRHVQRMNPDRLTRKIFNYFKKLKMCNTWFKEREKDIEAVSYTHLDVYKRQVLCLLLFL